MTYYDFDEPDYDADRSRAVDWAKETLRSPFLILDTETTGLGNTSEAVQIAIIDSKGDRIFESLINTVGDIEPRAEAIHGISREKIVHAPTFDKLYLELKFLLESKKILIYNASFDTRIINQQCRINDLPGIKVNAECVMNWYSQYCGHWNDYHSSYTWQRLPGGDHSALGDCRATLAVIKEMAGAT